jgi:hypothetical protein
MQNNAGFFNPSDESLERFSKLMISDMPLVDILGSWLKDEVLYSSLLSNADKVRLRYLEPFWSEKPWTSVLKGKKILVVHPFSKTIEQQYEKRASLFDNADVLPTFASLQTIKAVQSIGNESNGFKTWFNALEYMEKQIDASDFDIALIGCGAYGFPLAAHVKRLGKKAVHMGGSLQLLFGIKGKRWFDPSDVAHYKAYHHLLNSNWVNPDESEKPAKANNVEGGCYW